MANAQVTQSIVEIILLQNPHAQVCQSVVEMITIPGPTPPPPPPTAGQPSTPVGGPAYRSKGGCLPKNRWDDCLDAYELLLRNIRFPASCSIPQEYRNLLPWEDDFGAIPPQSIPVRQTGGITTPQGSAGDRVMIQYRVPEGYFALLSGFYFAYSGTGFSQGSGDLVFRMKVNQYYVKDLSNVLFTLGSSRFPIPMTEGHIVRSDDVVQMIVNAPNLSGLIQAGQSTCSAGLFGFAWPMG